LDFFNDIIILKKYTLRFWCAYDGEREVKMRKNPLLKYITLVTLMLIISALVFTSCQIGGGDSDMDGSGSQSSQDGVDDSDSAGNSSVDGSSGGNGDINTSNGKFFWSEGSTLYILSDGKAGYEWDDRDVFSRLNSIIGKYPEFVTDTDERAGNELVIGEHSERYASKLAYRRLEELVDSDDEAGYVIYYSRGSIAIAYSSTLAYDAAMERFFELYGDKTELEVTQGLLYSESFNVDRRIDTLREKYRSAEFENIRAELGDGITDALQTLYSMYGSDWYIWMANLYAPEYGGFYFSNSARDSLGYYPDLESTMQVLDNISWSGAFSHYDIPSSVKAYSVFMSGDMREALLKFVLEMQSSSDGYFYHPQWGTDIGVSRQGRDLNWATTMLSQFGVQPYYDTQNGVAGSRGGLVAPVSLRSPERGASAVLAASSSRAYLKSVDKWREYLTSLDFNGDSYTMGNEIESQSAQIIEADRRLWLSQNPSKKASDYSVKSPAVGGYIDIFEEHLNSLQSPETGFWQVVKPGEDRDGEDDGLTYESINGFMKITSCYKKFSRKINYAEEATRSIITVTKYRDDENDTHVCSIYNPWQSFGHIYPIIDEETKAKILQLLRENAEEMIYATIEKIAIHYKHGGGFSYFEKTPCNTAQGADVACALEAESDVNAACISVMGLSGAIFNAIGENYLYPYIPADGDRFVDIISNLGTAIKDSEIELPDGDFYQSYIIGDRYDFEDSSQLPPINIWPDNKQPDAKIAIEDGVLVFTKAMAEGDTVDPADSEEYISVPANSKMPKKNGVQCLELDFLAGGLEGLRGSFSRIRIDGGGLRITLNINANSKGQIYFVNSAGRAYKTTPYLECDKFYKLRFEFYYNVDGGVVKLFVNNKYALTLTGLEVRESSGHTRAFMYLHKGYDGAYIKLDNLFVGYIQREYKEESDVVKGVFDPTKGYYESQVSTGNIFDYYDVDTEPPAISIWPDDKIADATLEIIDSKLLFTKKMAVGDPVHPADSEEYFALPYSTSHVPTENSCQIFELDASFGGLDKMTGSFGKFMLYGGTKRVNIGMSVGSNGQIYFIDQDGRAVSGTPYLNPNTTYKLRFEFYYNAPDTPVKLFVNNQFVTELTGLLKGTISSTNRAFVYLHKGYDGAYMKLDDIFCGYASLEYSFAESVPLFPKNEEEPPEGGETPPEGGETPPEGGEVPPEGGETPPDGGDDNTPEVDSSEPFNPEFIDGEDVFSGNNYIEGGWVEL